MADTSTAVQAEFKALVERIQGNTQLDRPVAILVFSDTCPACAGAKAQFSALADEGYRDKVDFYQIPFSPFSALRLDREVKHVPTYLLYDLPGTPRRFLGPSAEPLKKTLVQRFPDVVFVATPPA
ncbi:hypothetical protein D3C80_1426950 [compost metagenome]